MAVVTFVNVCYLTLSMRVTNIGTNFSAKTFEKDYRYHSDWYSNIKFVNFFYVSSHLHELAMVKLLVVEK